MDNKDLEKCPYCGGTDMCNGRQIGQASIIPLDSFLTTRFRSNTYYMQKLWNYCKKLCKKC